MGSGLPQTEIEVARNEERRFEFGRNWRRFLGVLDADRVREAQKGLEDLLGLTDLTGQRFLDIGSGSGLHSLVARNLGAEVLSFDYDEESVACTKAVRSRYRGEDQGWKVERGSILDESYLDGVGEFDVVYSWGVLHHTGNLWLALYNAQRLVRSGGHLLVAIYNDQGWVSCFWRLIKKTYCSGWLGRCITASIFFPVFFLAGLLADLFTLRNPTLRYKEHRRYRGMSLTHDWRDWLGGYPYEVSRPDNVTAFLRAMGFESVRFVPTGHGFGNNQFAFRRSRAIPRG